MAAAQQSSASRSPSVKPFHVGLTPPRGLERIQIGRVLNEDAIVVKIGGKYCALHIKGADKASRHWNKLMQNEDLFGVVADAHARGKTQDIRKPHNSRFLSPVPDNQLLWGAGVTYGNSFRERRLEALSGGKKDLKDVEDLGQLTEYDKVYDPKKGPPEVFFKGLPAHVAMDRVCVRGDSPDGKIKQRLLPEPEVGVFVNDRKQPVAFVSNSDSTTCSFEQIGTLLLAQAKVYEASTTIQPMVTAFNRNEVEFGPNGMPVIDMTMRIQRGDRIMTRGDTSTSQMVRPLDQIIEAIARLAPSAKGGWDGGFYVSTGTGIIPQHFSLKDGDIVRITSPQLGDLVARTEVINFDGGRIFTA